MVTLAMLGGETYMRLRETYGAQEIVALYIQAMQKLEETGIATSLGLRECKGEIVYDGELFGAERIEHPCSPISLEQFRLPIVLHPTLIVGCEDAGLQIPEGLSWLKSPVANAIADVFRNLGFQPLALRQYQDRDNYTDVLRILISKDHVGFHREGKTLTAYLRFGEV